MDEQGERPPVVVEPAALLTPPRLLASVPRVAEPDVALEELRELFQKDYLKMLRDRHVQHRIKKILRTGTAKELVPLLQVMMNALVPSVKGASQSPVAVTLVNANIPRPSSG